MILMGLFQLRIFYDSRIHYFLLWYSHPFKARCAFEKLNAMLGINLTKILYIVWLERHFLAQKKNQVILTGEN